MCTNFGAVSEQLKFIVRDFDARVLTQKTYDIAPKRTFSVATSLVNVLTIDDTFDVGETINQGSVTILSTAPEEIVCSAMLVNVSALYPEGAALAMVPQNAAPGTQEMAKAVGDPLKPIYRVAGVLDSGSAVDVGRATAFPCTNFSTVTERVKIVIRSVTGTQLANKDYDIGKNRTYTVSTHGSLLYAEDDSISPGAVLNQGSAVISASNPAKVFCSAVIFHASVTIPRAIDLHMARFNPIPGSME